MRLFYVVFKSRLTSRNKIIHRNKYLTCLRKRNVLTRQGEFKIIEKISFDMVCLIL